MPDSPRVAMNAAVQFVSRHPFLVGWDGRPQEFGAQLGLGEVDVAIAGDDWVASARTRTPL